MRIARLSLFVSITTLLAGYGCSSEAEGGATFEAELEADTHTPWKVHVDPRSGEVRVLAPKNPVDLPGATIEDKARGFFQRYAAKLHASRAEVLEIDDSVADGADGWVRFRHVLAGDRLPIFDTASVAEMVNGRVVFVESGFHADVSKITRTPTVTKERAETLAIESVRAQCRVSSGDVEVHGSVLGVRAEEGTPAALAWQVDLRAEGDCVAPRIFVDATREEILGRQERAASVVDRVGGVRYHALGDTHDVKEIDVSRDWDLLGSKWVMRTEGSDLKVRTMSYGTFVGYHLDVQTRTLGSWEESSKYRGAAVDAHHYAGKALQYFRDVHKRNSFDGKGTELVIVVHDPEKAKKESQSDGVNAHYQDRGIFFHDDQLHIGDGDGKDWLPLSAAFDVVAHELAHAVTSRTSRLVYAHESGALNEAFSDVMGASAERWLGETKDERKNLTIGERATKSGAGFRRMDDPGMEGLPDNYGDRKGCPTGQAPNEENDHCAVHSNSSIANRAFSLMTLGGTHRMTDITVAKGIGWDKAQKLWYESFTKLWPQATFYQAALVQTAHAATMGVETLMAVTCAWRAVGVLDAIDVQSRDVSCPAAAPRAITNCDGVEDGIVCNSVVPYSASVCKNRKFASTMHCPHAGQRCKPRSPTDPTATVEGGILVCE